MNQFQNRTVKITLQDSSHVEGIVSSVSNGKLTLSNVYFLETHSVLPVFTLIGSNIKDLEILANKPSSAPKDDTKGNHGQIMHDIDQKGQIFNPSVQDPAIVSAKPASSSAKAKAKAKAGSNNNIVMLQNGDGSSDESDIEITPYSARKENFTPVKRTPKGSRTPRTPRGDNRNQWANENLNAIANTDFDFEANLQRFDKNLVFEEIRQADQTDPRSRLVSHNKMQAKYGNKEMVLETDASSIAESTLSSSETAPSLSLSRKPSQGIDTGMAHFIANNRQCPSASPLQLVGLYRSLNKYGLSNEAINESAGRGIAQIAIQILGGITRFTVTNHNAGPLTIILIGNNISGIQAMVAGRMLASRGVHVVGLLLKGLADSTDSTDSSFMNQCKALEASGGKLVHDHSQMITEISKFNTPAELVIDGLQGYEVSIDDFWGQEDQIKLIINWANSLRAKIISIDMPSGVDASTGKVSSLGCLNSKFILSCGLPLTGLLNDANMIETTSYYLIDVGFPKIVFKSPSFRKFQQIWFGSEWVIELKVSN